MKKIKRILFILLVILLSLAAASYIDFYIVKTRNTTPKIAIRKDIDENLTVYNAIMYRLWYCKSNKKYTLGDYKDSNAVCFSNDSYDENGNYKNKENLLITKSDLELYSQYYTQEQISNMKIENIENAKLFINEYGKLQYKKIEKDNLIKSNNTNSTANTSGNNTNTKNNKNKYDLVVFAEYKLNNKNNYELVYDETKVYCLNEKEEIAIFDNNMCGIYKKIEFNYKICELYLETKMNTDERLIKLCSKEIASSTKLKNDIN